MKNKKAMFLGIILLLILSLMLPLGCAKEAETPTPTEFKTYSKYGFSFEYHKKFTVTESGFMENEANDNSGMVQVAVENKELQFFQAAWFKIIPSGFEATGGLEESLEGGFEAFERGSGLQADIGELVETTKSGHQILYQYYSVSNEAFKTYGIQGVFYCDESQRFFQLMTMNSTISAKQDILEDFQRYLDSFVCH